jgi:hypothetical protein
VNCSTDTKSPQHPLKPTLDSKFQPQLTLMMKSGSLSPSFKYTLMAVMSKQQQQQQQQPG